MGFVCGSCGVQKFNCKFCNEKHCLCNCCDPDQPNCIMCNAKIVPCHYNCKQCYQKETYISTDEKLITMPPNRKCAKCVRQTCLREWKYFTTQCSSIGTYVISYFLARYHRAFDEEFAATPWIKKGFMLSDRPMSAPKYQTIDGVSAMFELVFSKWQEEISPLE